MTSSVAAPVVARTARNSALDGLRGTAATAVVFYHSILFQAPGVIDRELVTPALDLRGTTSILARAVLTAVSGHVAVILFFVLSGFVLARSLDRMDDAPLRLAIRFAVRRLFRLYPPIFASLAFFAAIVAGWSAFGFPPLRGLPPFQLSSILQNATLINVAWYGPTWTIQGEVLAIPFLLIFHFARRGFGSAGLLLCFCYCLVSYQTQALVLNLPNMSIVLTPMCLGMLLSTGAGKALFERTSQAVLWITAAMLFCLTFFYNLDQPPFTELARVILCGVLVAGCYYGEQNAFVRLLSSPIPRYLGRISYSLYLVNVPVFILLSPMLPHDSLRSGIALGLLATLVSMPVADLFERFVEQRGIRSGEALFTRRAIVNESATLPPRPRESTP